MLKIDLGILLEILKPTIGAVLGIWLKQKLEKRPKVIYYLDHVAAFKVNIKQEEKNNKIDVFTHKLIVKNTGKLPAKNVRIGHNYLPPDFTIFPSIDYKVEKLPSSENEDIVIAILRPDEQIAISYLYSPPYTYNQINTDVKFDDGFAKLTPVVLTPQITMWQMRILEILVMIGFVAVVYFIINSIIWIWSKIF